MGHRCGNGNTAHPRRQGGLDTHERIFDNQAIFRSGIQFIGHQQVDFRVRFGPFNILPPGNIFKSAGQVQCGQYPVHLRTNRHGRQGDPATRLASESQQGQVVRPDVAADQLGVGQHPVVILQAHLRKRLPGRRHAKFGHARRGGCLQVEAVQQGYGYLPARHAHEVLEDFNDFVLTKTMRSQLLDGPGVRAGFEIFGFHQCPIQIENHRLDCHLISFRNEGSRTHFKYSKSRAGISNN